MVRHTGKCEQSTSAGKGDVATEQEVEHLFASTRKEAPAMHHSLEAAILDGTIPETTTETGLSPLDLERLSEAYGQAQILVHLQNEKAHARIVISVDDMILWRAAPTPRIVRGIWWYVEHFVSAWPLEVIS